MESTLLDNVKNDHGYWGIDSNLRNKLLVQIDYVGHCALQMPTNSFLQSRLLPMSGSGKKMNRSVQPTNRGRKNENFRWKLNPGFNLCAILPISFVYFGVTVAASVRSIDET